MRSRDEILVVMFCRLFRPTILNRQQSALTKFVRTCETSSSLISTTQDEVSAQENFLPITVKDVNVEVQPEKQNVLIHGWVKAVRKMGRCYFVDLTDNITKHRIQTVVPWELLDGSQINMGTAVTVKGVLQPCQPGLKQDREVAVSDIKIHSYCSKEVMPFDLRKPIALPAIRHNINSRHLVSNMKSVLKVRSCLMMAVYEYMKLHEFVNVTTPVITSNNCEGGSEVFSVRSPLDKEGKMLFENAFLTVSGQLHLELLINAFPKVYTMSPAFRAENQLSRRHVSEFIMVELEEAFLFTLDELLDRTEDFIRFLANFVKSHCDEDLQILKTAPGVEPPKYDAHERFTSSKKYLRLTYDDALEVISKFVPKGIEPISFGSDLKRQHEKVIQDYFEGYPVFITHYPAKIKPFYMKQDGDRALNFDLLGGIGGELVGGSLREDNYELLDQRLSHLEKKEELKWYLDSRRMGQPPHGGFGLGFDRLIMSLGEVGNIRDVMPFPRWAHSLQL